MNTCTDSHLLNTTGSNFQTNTTLLELIEKISEHISSLAEDQTLESGKKYYNSNHNKIIAWKVENLFSSGRIKFKRFNEIVKSFPELLIK